MMDNIKIQIRRNVFETNSSMMHAMVLANDYEYESFKNGYLNINLSTVILTEDAPDGKNILNYHDFIHYFDNDKEYDMMGDDEFPPPGTIEHDDYLGNHKIHYKW